MTHDEKSAGLKDKYRRYLVGLVELVWFVTGPELSEGAVQGAMDYTVHETIKDEKRKLLSKRAGGMTKDKGTGV